MPSIIYQICKEHRQTNKTAVIRKFGLIGNPLSHSFSIEYFHQKFLSENITDCVYENFQLKNLDNLRSLIYSDMSISGLNFTIPYKIEVLPYLDETDHSVKEVQAVNCVKIIRTNNTLHLKGYNTDMPAFKGTLQPLLRHTNLKALVFGTGGAARAVCQALKELKIDYSQVSRREQTGLLRYTELDGRIIDSHKLIINATPVGMSPIENLCPPLPYEYLTSEHLLYDLIYNPEETLFLKKGTEAGSRIKNGLEMLQLQAELSWAIWHE